MISRRLVCLAAVLFAPFAALAQSGDPKFDAFLRAIRAEAAKAGVDAGTLDTALGRVQEIPEVMELARNQPEFKMTFDRYLEIVVSPERVKRGRALLAENRALVDRFAGPAGIPDRSWSRCGASRATTARGSATSRSSPRWRRWSTTTSAPSSSASS